MLQIEHLTKTYGEKKAVDDLSLHILLLSFLLEYAGSISVVHTTLLILPLTDCDHII